MILQGTDLQPFFSSYLQGGYKQDNLSLLSVEFAPPCIDGYIDVVQCFMPGDGKFHLTVPLAFICIAQLGIIYGCFDNKLSKKGSEIYLREIELKCKRPIGKMQGILFRLEVIGKKIVPDGIFYKGRIDIEDKSFVGFASFILPLTTSVPDNI